MLAKLLRRMDPSRFKNVVISLTPAGPLTRVIEASGVPVHSLEMRRACFDVKAFPKLVRMIKQIRPAILQTWLYHADLMGAAASIIVRAPHLVWNIRCSDMELAQYPATTRLTLKLLSLCSRLPRAVIVNSQAGRWLHEKIGYRVRRWEAIPNGFDVDQFKPDGHWRKQLRRALGVSEDAILIGMVARVDPMKDHATFIEAARQLAKIYEDVAFVLVGKNVESLASQVATSGLLGKVHLLGFREDVSKVMPALDVFSLTSVFGEGFPNVVGEAMACGVPCVVTDVGDSSLLVGEVGRVVPRRSPESLMEQWLELIRMGPENRIKLGSASRERIMNYYSIESIANRYERCYEDLVNQPIGI